MSQTLQEDLQALLALQGIDSQIDRLRATLAALDTGASTVAAYNAQKAEATRLREAANRAQAVQRDAELKLASIETKAAQVNRTLYGGTVSASRELENLGKEIEMLGRQKDSAEEEVLVAMEAAGEALGLADAAEALLAELTAQYKKVRTAFLKRQDELQAEEKALMPQRERAAGAVSRPDLLARYDTLRQKKAGVGIAALALDHHCGACRTKINTTLAENVAAGEAPQVCEYCGRLLVVE